MTALTLEAFRQTGVRHTAEEGLEKLGITSDYLAGTGTTHLRIYDGDCYIEEGPNGFYLLLELDEYEGSLEDLEERLHAWAVEEG